MPYQDTDPHRTGIGGRFPLGRTIYSPRIAPLFERDPVVAMSVNALLRLHQNGQWGTVSAEQAGANERALVDGGEIVSRYHVQGRAILMVTDAARETTTVLLPEEYESEPDPR